MSRRKKIKKILLNQGTQYLDEKLKNIIINGHQLSLNSGCCYAVCQIVQNVLAKFNIKTKIIRVSYLIANNKGWDIMITGVEQRKDPAKIRQEIFDSGDGWTLGLGYENKPDSFHFILMTDKDEIIDLTIGQASRPKYNLGFEPFWCKEKDLPENIREIKAKPNDEAISIIKKGILQIEGKTYFKNIEMGLLWLIKRFL